MQSVDDARIYHVLDGFRGVAALAVLINHTTGTFGATHLLGSTQIAVDIFFVVSGFVLAHAYEKRFAAGMTVAEFMRKRLVRFYPLYILGIVIIPVAYYGAHMVGVTISDGRSASLLDMSFNLFFLPTPNQGKLFPPNTPAWSLFFELAINLIYVVIWKWLSTPRLISVVAASVVALAVAGIHYGSLDIGYDWNSLLGGAARVCFGFSAGVLTYRISARFGGVPLVGYPVLIAVVALVLSAHIPDGWLRAIYDLCAVVIIAPAVVMLGAQIKVSGRIAESMKFVGAISYALYVLHYPVLIIFKRATLQWSDLSPNIASAVYVGIALCIASGAHYCFDVPIRRAMSRRAKRLMGPA